MGITLLVIIRGQLPPPWEQLAKILRDKIRKGDWKPGEQITPILTLASEYELAPLTVRKAIDHLKERGWLESRAGYGTFVTRKPPVDQPEDGR